MKEILFRGKVVNTDEWVEGYLVYAEDVCKPNDEITPFIFEPDAINFGYGEFSGVSEVIPETVGQYTGVTDRSGRKIFEGDILVFCKGATYPYKVIWDGMGWKLIRSDGKRIKEAFECNEIHYVKISEVIGNIHDNPELLEGGGL